MTMAKIFAWNTLPERFKRMRRKTLIRELFANTIAAIVERKVHLLPKAKYLWHFRRILAKINQNQFSNQSLIMQA